MLPNDNGKQHKTRQLDLFTGELDVGPPKKGNGRHIKLTREEVQLVKTIGMAHFPGSGPERTYCHQCKHCQDIDVFSGGRYYKPKEYSGAGNALPIQTRRNACVKAAELFDGIVQRGGISSNRPCKYSEPRQRGVDIETPTEPHGDGPEGASYE